MTETNKNNAALTEEDYNEVVKKTAIYPDAETGAINSLSYATLGLVGEAGEVAEKVKKIIRGDKTLEDTKETLILEIGDVIWYLHTLARELDTTYEEIRNINANKLLSRLERNVLKGDGDMR